MPLDAALAERVHLDQRIAHLLSRQKVTAHGARSAKRSSASVTMARRRRFGRGQQGLIPLIKTFLSSRFGMVADLINAMKRARVPCPKV